MPLAFFTQTWEELKKVTWPKQDDVVRLTITVILVSLLVGAFVGGLDFLFTGAIQMVLK